MKNIKKAFTIILSMVLIAGFGCLSAFAADGEEPSKDDFGDKIYKAKYTITVYSGKEGNFGGKTGAERHATAHYGDSVRVDLYGNITVTPKGGGTGDVVPLNFAVNDGSKYYARGLKYAGHDNDETEGMGRLTVVDTVTGDLSYTVAYGLNGGLVKYTVHYVNDATGEALLPSATYYGMAGDRPVVSFQYIEGYAPTNYNQTQYLTKNEADNDFTFRYAESDLTAEEQAAAAAAPVTVVRNGANGTGNANANAGSGANNADGTAIGDNATPAAGAPNVVDLDDGNTPQAAPQSDVPKSELSRQKTMGFIIGGVCVAAAIAAAAVAIARRRQYEYEDDDE